MLTLMSTTNVLIKFLLDKSVENVFHLTTAI